MADVAFTFFMIALMLFGIGAIVYIIGGSLHKNHHQVSLNIQIAAIVILCIGIVFGISAATLDTIVYYTTEYVECERCGERVPKEQYEQRSE